eukprot:SAG31_NODE_5261_length_2644_cov_2.116306_2_plen_169_part_00
MLMPQMLDLESLRGTGLTAGETAMPEDNAPAPAPAAAETPVDEVALMSLMSMGFDQAKCTKALRQCGNSVERATDWIFSHMDDDGNAEPATAAGGADEPPAAEVSDGPGQYELKGFISHMGKNLGSGHYVCHIKLDGGKWCIFNDEKVQECTDPPFDMGYLYFYTRKQ